MVRLFLRKPATSASAGTHLTERLAQLAAIRAATTMPWEPRKVRLYQTIFPQMSNWLPEEEAAQLRFEFAQEMQRLAKAA